MPANFPARLVRLLVECHVELGEEEQFRTSAESAQPLAWCPGLAEKSWKCPPEHPEPAREPPRVRESTRTSLEAFIQRLERRRHPIPEPLVNFLNPDPTQLWFVSRK